MKDTHATDARFAEALQALHAGRFAQAIVELQNAIDAGPGAVIAHVYLGDAYAGARSPAAAEDAYRAALKLWPDCPEAHIGLGRLVIGEERIDEAIAALETGTRLQPGNAGGLLSLALVHEQRADFERAERNWRSLLASTPDHVDVIKGLARAAGDRQAARSVDAGAKRKRGGTQRRGRAIPAGQHPAADAGAARIARGLPTRDHSAAITQGALRRGESAPDAGRVRRGLGGIRGTPGHARHDVQIPLLSLPHRFGTTLETIPSVVPYLRRPQGAEVPGRRRIDDVDVQPHRRRQHAEAHRHQHHDVEPALEEVSRWAGLPGTATIDALSADVGNNAQRVPQMVQSVLEALA